MAIKSLHLCPLLLITDRHQARRSLSDIVEESCAAGCRWVSVREHDLSPAEQVELIQALRPIIQRWNARLTLHGHAETARAAGADGVHLKAGSDMKTARGIMGEGALIGISIHNLADAQNIDPALIDYAILGPIFETASKPGYGPTLGLEGLAKIARLCPVPLLAIGGITAAHIPAIMKTGAAGIALMGGVMRAENPGEEARDLLAALQPRPR